MSSPSDPTTDALIAAALGERSYPSGTVFVDATMESAGDIFAELVTEECSFVIVLPDGDELFYTPRVDLLSRWRRMLFLPLFRRRFEGSGPLVTQVDPDATSFDVTIKPVRGFNPPRLHGGSRMPEPV